MSYKSIILSIFSAAILAICQFSFISSLPLYLANLNFVVVVLIFVLVLNGLEKCLWWTAVAAFLFEVYAFSPFGAYFISYFAALVAADFLLNNFFTDRSLYSFSALVFFATIFYNFIFSIIIYLFGIFTGGAGILFFKVYFWKILGIELALNLFAGAILFYVSSLINRKLRPVFLKKG